jgi:hypothetical protein
MAVRLNPCAVHSREEIQNRNRLLDFGGKKFKIEIDSSILAGRYYDTHYIHRTIHHRIRTAS